MNFWKTWREINWYLWNKYPASISDFYVRRRNLLKKNSLLRFFTHVFNDSLFQLPEAKAVNGS